MKINISISASPLTVDQHVIVKQDSKTWLAGKITKVINAREGTKYTVKYNNGSTKVLDIGTQVKPISDSTLSKPINMYRVQRLISDYKEEKAKKLVRDQVENAIVKPNLENFKVTKESVEEFFKKKKIKDPLLAKKLLSLSCIIGTPIITTKVETIQNAGFFPFSGNARTVKLFNGKSVSKAEFFGMMQVVKGGLKGRSSAPWGLTKGSAPSRIGSGSVQGTGQVTISGFIVPQGWIAHYTKKYKIPLNLFNTSIKGKNTTLNVFYVNKKPVF